MSAVVRVMVHDAWDEVVLPWHPGTVLADIKASALELTRVTAAPDDFILKFNGAELRDESRTLADSGVPQNGALIVLRRRRRPLR